MEKKDRLTELEQIILIFYGLYEVQKLANLMFQILEDKKNEKTQCS